MSTSPGQGFQGGTGYLLAMAGAASRRRWVEGLAQLNVTPSQFKVIMTLREVDSLGQRQLAELVGIDPRNCVPIIDSLVERGLVSRQVDGTDRRRRDLWLTKKGRQLAARLEAVNAEIEVTLMSSLDLRDRTALHRMLITILGAAEGEA
ncbi:MAG: MarR family winged helix-turn-helix transcriptional regulator [Acidimicrobiales bacterium]